jgi:hypothetical protein
MILHIHSDASYLSVSNARIRLGGLFFCGDKTAREDTLNGFIINVASVIKHVVASVAESEVGACFQNAQSGASLRVTLTELGHIQPATPLGTDKYTALGILNETMKQKDPKQWTSNLETGCLPCRPFHGLLPGRLTGFAGEAEPFSNLTSAILVGVSFLIVSYQ